MLQRRTDLAVEAEALSKPAAAPEGVRVREERREGCPVTRVEILDGRGEAALGKPVGTYVTVDLTGLVRREEEAFPRSCRALAGELSHLLRRCRVFNVPGPANADFYLFDRENFHRYESPEELNTLLMRLLRDPHYRFERYGKGILLFRKISTPVRTKR